MSRIIQKITAVLLSVLMITTAFNALPFTASAVTIVDRGTTGHCTWTLDDNGTLTISGNGDMRNSIDNTYNLFLPCCNGDD